MGLVELPDETSESATEEKANEVVLIAGDDSEEEEEGERMGSVEAADACIEVVVEDEDDADGDVRARLRSAAGLIRASAWARIAAGSAQTICAGRHAPPIAFHCFRSVYVLPPIRIVPSDSTSRVVSRLRVGEAKPGAGATATCATGAWTETLVTESD
jgi:hypothetical protein